MTTISPPTSTRPSWFIVRYCRGTGIAGSSHWRGYSKPKVEFNQRELAKAPLHLRGRVLDGIGLVRWYLQRSRPQLLQMNLLLELGLVTLSLMLRLGSKTARPAEQEQERPRPLSLRFPWILKKRYPTFHWGYYRCTRRVFSVPGESTRGATSFSRGGCTRGETRSWWPSFGIGTGWSFACRISAVEQPTREPTVVVPPAESEIQEFVEDAELPQEPGTYRRGFGGTPAFHHSWVETRAQTRHRWIGLIHDPNPAFLRRRKHSSLCTSSIRRLDPTGLTLTRCWRNCYHCSRKGGGCPNVDRNNIAPVAPTMETPFVNEVTSTDVKEETSNAPRPS